MAPIKNQEKVLMIRSETDIFSENSYDVCIQSGGISEYHPTSAISDQSAPITFFIQGNDSQYIDLAESALYIRGKIVNKDGGAVGEYAAMKVAPVNNFLHSLFQQVTIHLNETQITPTTSLYAYRAYLEAMLSFSGDYEQTQGASALYSSDRTSEILIGDGFKNAQERVKGGLEFDMIGRPHVDICAQNRYIIPGIDVRFTFQKTSAPFYMIVENAQVDKAFTFNVTQAKLLIKKHTLLPSILLNHMKIWESGIPATYPMRRIEMKSYTLPTGTSQNTNENILNGMLPDKLIVGLVKTSSLHGAYGEYPYLFSPHDLSEISVTANGEQVYHRSYNIDFDKRI